MSSEQSKAANQMQRRFDPYFKKWGFSKNGRIYNKVCENNLTQLATIELEGTRQAGNFDIELSIYMPEVHDYLTDYPVSGKLKNVDCCIRHHLTELAQGFGAKWWRISSEAQSVANTMQIFEFHGVSYFEQYSSRQNIFDDFANRNENYGYGNPPKVVAALICLGRGDRATASQLLFEQASQTNIKGHRDYVLELAHKHQLLPKLTHADFNTFAI